MFIIEKESILSVTPDVFKQFIIDQHGNRHQIDSRWLLALPISAALLPSPALAQVGIDITFDSATFQVEENDLALDVSATATVNNGYGGSCTIDVPAIVTGGNATQGSDFAFAGATFTFTLPLSSTSGPTADSDSVTLNIFQDGLVEIPETINLAFGTPTLTGSCFGLSSANAAGNTVITIIDNDVPQASLSSIDSNASESGLDPGQCRVELDQPGLTDNLTINYSVSGSATPGSDYAALPGNVTIQGSGLSADIEITPLLDDLAEPDETVILTLQPGDGYILSSPLSCLVTISDAPPLDLPPQVSITAGGNAAEEGLVNGEFTITLDRLPATGALTVFYSVGGTATPSEDYQALSDSVTFDDNNPSRTITIEPLSDNLIEGNETVQLTLLTNPGYVVNPAASQATILITDITTLPVPQVSITAVSNAAEDGLVNGAFNVTLDRPPPTGSLTVFYSIAGTAIEATDYESLTGSVTFNAGETTPATIPVVPLFDNEPEEDETVQLTLLTDPNYVVNPAASQATILITDFFSITHLPPLPPNQRETARAIENLCRGRAATDNFLRDCNALIGAVITGDPNAITALSQITPDDVSTAVDAAETSVQAQLLNIRTRLFTLRRGRTGIDIDNLNLDFDAWALSGKHLRVLLEQQGGGASADDNGDAQSRREPSRLGGFISGNVNLGDRDSTENQDGFDFNTYGLTAGLDYRFTDELVLGGALTYSTSDTDINDNGGDLDSDGYAITFYGTYYISDRIYIDGSLSYGRYDYDQQRNLRYQLDSINVEQTFDTDYDGDQYAVDISGGYEFVWNRMIFGPTLRLSYVESEIDAFNEHARNDNPGSAWAVSIDKQTQRSFTTSFGGQVSYVFHQSWGSWTPQIEANWVHEFLGDDLVINGRFVEGNNVLENNFRLNTDDLDQNYFSFSAGVSAQWSVGGSAFLEYSTVLEYDNLSEHAINAGIRWEF